MSAGPKAGVRLFAYLSEPPQRRWPDGFIHHGTRVLAIVGLALVLTFLFPPVSRLVLAPYSVGMVADEDLIAAFTFGVPKPTEELERERVEAAGAVSPTLRVRSEAPDSMAAHLERFFRDLAGAADTGGEQAVTQVLTDHNIAASPVQIRLATDSAGIRTLRTAALEAATEVLPLGVIDPAQMQRFTTPSFVVIAPDEEPRRVARESILTAREFYDRSERLLPTAASPAMAELLRLILIHFSQYSLVLDEDVTERDREQARASVETTKSTILAGEAIVRANQAIRPAELERLNAYQDALRERGLAGDRPANRGPFAGSILLNGLVLGMFGLLLYFFRREVYGSFTWFILHVSLIFAYFGLAAFIVGGGFPSELLPVAIAPLAVAVLWDGRLALILALTLGVLTGIQHPFNRMEIWAPVILGGAAAALSVRAVRRRAQVWVFIAIISAVYAASFLALGLLLGTEPAAVLSSIGWGVVNATASAILVMGFLPAFEWFTGITTDQTLLEWADTNRPLLRRLSLEAPGTYAHTINVANIAEAAANAIGANGLLCRVGVYYHDVGKVLKPQYFIENQPVGRNPHDKLKPATSAALVREHVTEGCRLAEEARLPASVAAFIPEHHGTQLISFFYAKALEEHDEAELDGADFRYPGPKPRSRETAIALLADSVESAARALHDPTPTRVSELISSLVDSKLQDGQLDDSPLTLREIAVIKAQFAKVVSGMYHQRIDYPETRHLTSAAAEKDVPTREEAVS